jgi:chloramphenicol 3-O phosphotransferase
MVLTQAAVVHRGVADCLEVDTMHTEALECARAIAARVALANTSGVVQRALNFMDNQHYP